MEPWLMQSIVFLTVIKNAFPIGTASIDEFTPILNSAYSPVLSIGLYYRRYI